MFLNFDDLASQERYKLLTAAVVPRPIALVSTLSEGGHVNAAPFSFFNVFSEAPALAILGLESRRDTGKMKDTTRNILQTGELVINLVDRPMVDAMAACAADLAPGDSELDFAGLTRAESRCVAPPGIAEAPIRFECRLFEMRQITPVRHVCMAEILALHARPGLLDKARMHIDTTAYTPVGRLHGAGYCEITTRFESHVPNVETKSAMARGDIDEDIDQ